MEKARSVAILILVGATVTVALASGLILMRKGVSPRIPRESQVRGIPKLTQGEVLSMEESGIPQEALKSTDRLAGDGIKTVLSHDYQPGTPLVEISFLKRNADGTTEPFALSTVEILSADGRGPSIGLDGAHGLREDVTRDPNSRRGMMRGKTYKIASYIPMGEHTGIKTAPLDPVFQVPEDLPPNSVFRVKLIIKDEIAEQQALAREEAKAEEAKRLTSEEQIIVNVSDALPGRLVGIYHDGTRSREFYGQEGARSLTLKGPNKLGGELAVYAMSPDGRSIETWAYTPKLDKRQVDMPKDAQMVVRQSDLVPITITLAGVESKLLSGYRIIAFYLSETTHIRLFSARLPQSPTQGGPGDSIINMEVKPGTYAVRVIGDKVEDLPLTTLQISSERSATYKIELRRDSGVTASQEFTALEPPAGS